MIESKLPGCVFRGEEGNCTSFECLHPENKKTVTPEVCDQCPLRRESHLVLEQPSPQTKQSTLEYVAHGAVGLGKSLLGIDKASDETVQARWEICKSCEFFKFWRCTDCKCLVPAKIRVASEFCPQNKWKSENGKVA